MACRGIYFALTDEDAKRLLAADRDEAVIHIIQEEIEARWDKDWLQETDKAWDAIHRCLTDGSLRCNGRSSLEKVVLGGRQLHQGSAYIVSYLTPDEVREAAGSIRSITKEWFREKYFGLRRRFLGLFRSSDYEGSIDDTDFEYSWGNFGDVRQLYEKAATANRAIVFTVDQ
jgi:Domain of unknown function (DUF1877)